MRAEHFIQPALEKIWIVAQWKWELDLTTPWYRRVFFRWVYRPFIRFAWNVMEIPAPKGMTVEGDKQTVFWFENAGCFSSQDQADIACTSEWHGYKDLPLDRRMPDESVQFSSLVFPRQDNPRQSRKPTFSLIAKDRKQDEQEKSTLAACLTELNRNLDRALDRQ